MNNVYGQCPFCGGTLTVDHNCRDAKLSSQSMPETKMSNTIEQKLYQAHELLKEVILCLDPGSELHYEINQAMISIFLVGRNLPRNILSYIPQGHQIKN